MRRGGAVFGAIVAQGTRATALGVRISAGSIPPSRAWKLSGGDTPLGSIEPGGGRAGAGVDLHTFCRPVRSRRARVLKGTTGCIRTEVTRWAPPADVVLTTIAVESTGASSALQTALEVIAWRVSARRTREFCRPLGPSRTPVPTGTRLDGLATVSCTCNTCKCLWAGKAVGTRYEAGRVWIPSPGRARMLGRVDCP